MRKNSNIAHIVPNKVYNDFDCVKGIDTKFEEDLFDPTNDSAKLSRNCFRCWFYWIFMIIYPQLNTYPFD